MNYWETLELKPNASLEEVKTSYRSLVKKYHPDVNPEGEAKFKEISEAYDKISKSFEKPNLFTSNFFRMNIRTQQIFFRVFQKNDENSYTMYLPEKVLAFDSIIRILIETTQIQIQLPQGTELPKTIEVTNSDPKIKIKIDYQEPG